MSTERRKKKLRNEKIWICVAVCVVAALLIFAIVKMIANKETAKRRGRFVVRFVGLC